MEELNVWEPDCVGVIPEPVTSPVPVAGDAEEEEESQGDNQLDQQAAQQAAHGVDQSGDGQEPLLFNGCGWVHPGGVERSNENVFIVEMETEIEEGEIPVTPPDQADKEDETTTPAQAAKEGETTTPLENPDINVVSDQPQIMDGFLHGVGHSRHAHEVGSQLDLNVAPDLNHQGGPELNFNEKTKDGLGTGPNALVHIHNNISSFNEDFYIDNVNYFNNDNNNNIINNNNIDNIGVPVDYIDGVTPIPPPMGKRSRNLRSPSSLGSTQAPPTRVCYGDISPGPKPKDIISIENQSVESGVDDVRSLDVQVQADEAPGEQPHKGLNVLFGGSGGQLSSGKSATVESHINQQKSGLIFCFGSREKMEQIINEAINGQNYLLGSTEKEGQRGETIRKKWSRHIRNPGHQDQVSAETGGVYNNTRNGGDNVGR